MTKVGVSRDSVSAGDDVDGHASVEAADPDCSAGDFVDGIVADGYLPVIAGGVATWVVRAGRGGAPIGVVAQNGQRWDRLIGAGGRNRPMSAVRVLHFEYRAQVAVAQVLLDLKSERR